MTTYNTGNPIGSTDARDLYDNAQALDTAVNSTAATFTDRCGVVRPTLASAIDPTGLAQAAVNAKLAAEAASDAAQLSAGVFADTASGIAGTTSGQYFSVPSGSTGEYLTLYKNSSGSAVEVKRYPSARGVADLVLPAYASVGLGKPLNSDGDLDNDALTGDAFTNDVPTSAIETCSDAFLTSTFKIKKWVKFQANTGYTDNATGNNVYWPVSYTSTNEVIPAGKWIQTAYVVRIPSGGLWPNNPDILLWDGITAVTALAAYIEVDSVTRIYYATGQVPSGSNSTKILIGSHFGIIANDFHVGAFFTNVFDYKPMGLAVNVFRVSLADQILNKAPVQYASYNKDGKLPNKAPDYQFINIPAAQYVVNCDVEAIRKKYGVLNWLKVPANVDLFGDAVNGCYLAAKTPKGSGLPSGTWVQQAFLMYSPSGQFGTYDSALYLWDPVVAVDAPLKHKQIDANTRIYWSQYKITNQTSTTILAGAKYGIRTYDRYVGNWLIGLFDFEPQDLILDLQGNTAATKSSTLEAQLGGTVLPANPDWALPGGVPATGFINQPGAQYVIPCGVSSVKDSFGIDYWWKVAANVGQTDNGAMNNVFLTYSHPNGQALAAGTWVQQAYVIYSPSGVFPDPGGVLMWDPVAFVSGVSVEYVPVSQTVRIYYNTYQITNQTSTKTLIGNQHSAVYGYDFFIGGWSIATFQHKPLGLAINMSAKTLEKRVAALEKSAAPSSDAVLNYFFGSVDAVFLGDSITSGAGSTGGNTSWADRLHAKVKFKSYTKLAVSGATVKPTFDSSGGGFWRYKLSDEVAAIPAGTDLICMMIGVNDAGFSNPLGDVAAVIAKSYANLDQTQSFAEAFRYNLETIKRNFPSARVVVMLPVQWGMAYPTDNVELYREVERKIAAWLAVPVIEMQKESLLWAGSGMFPDGLHPNDTGYQLLADFMARRLISV